MPQNQHILGNCAADLILIVSFKIYINILELIDGIWTVLDDEMRLMTMSTQNFSQRIENTWKSHAAFTSATSLHSGEHGFSIRHFARDVFYNTVCEKYSPLLVNLICARADEKM